MNRNRTFPANGYTFCNTFPMRALRAVSIGIARLREISISVMNDCKTITCVTADSTDAGSESTHDDLDTLCDMFCAPLPNALHHM